MYWKHSRSESRQREPTPGFTLTVDLRNFIVFFLGRDPGTLKSDIVSKNTSTINLFGFETLKLKIQRLKLWKPTI